MVERLLVDDPETIRLLGSPIRQDLVDYLEWAGPSTVVELAVGLGTRPDRLYYHIERLREAGVVVERGPGEAGGKRVGLAGSSLALKYRTGDPERTVALTDAVGTMLRSAERRFEGALSGAVGEIELEGPTRNVWASRVRGRLAESDLEEANLLIDRLHQLFRRGRERASGAGRMHEVSVVLVPLSEPVAAADRACARLP